MSQTKGSSNLSLSSPAVKFRCIKQESTNVIRRQDNSPAYFTSLRLCAAGY